MNPSHEDPRAQWQRYRDALGDEPLPAALVDLTALDHNVDHLKSLVAPHPPKLRVASKSVRCVELLRYILARLGEVAGGVMTYTAAETAYLAQHGFDNLLLAYPTARDRDAVHLATANASGATAAVVVDAVEHLVPLDRAAAVANTVIPVVVELDTAWRPFGGAGYIGARRSPLNTPAAVLDLVERVAAFKHLKVHGLMAYEAHIAGLADHGQGAMDPALRWVKARARPVAAARRDETVRLLRDRGHPLALVNGAGTGSLATAAREPCLTEVTAGSGFLDSHLFDGYDGLNLVPAAGYAIQVVRRPREGMVTCHGGGFAASGGAGPDRLPKPWLPVGCSLLPREGAGEVQTPLELGAEVQLSVGDPVFFRHAKAGELAEHVREYLGIRGDRVEARFATYRGDGQCFLG